MPTPVPSEYRYATRYRQNFGALYIAMVLLSLHWAIILFVNSSYLEQYVGNSTIGLLYTTSSAVTIIAFFSMTRILRTFGNYRLTLLFAAIEFAALLGMAAADSLRVATFLFMVHQAVVPLILYNLDIYMEEMIGDDEATTGSKRGLFLAIMSFASAIAPLASGFFLGKGEPRFSLVYGVSAALMLPFLYVIRRYFKGQSEPEYAEMKIATAFRTLWGEKDIRNVFFAHLLLQLFFTWMVIYTPLFLATTLGFNWQEIGLILFAGLFAYVLLEYPIGVIADRWLGEKEMMALGFIIIAISTSWFAFLSEATLGVWMVAMFMTRVGASFVEATTESYFFKHIKGANSNIISFFRVTRPFSYVIGAFIGSLALIYLPFNLFFVVLSLLMIPGLFFTMVLKDTR